MSIFDDTIEFSETFLYIFDKDQNRTKLLMNPVQKDFLKNKTGRDLVLKARQFGISTAIQADFFRLATTRRAVIATIAHDDKTTQKLRRMSERFYQNLPKVVKQPVRKTANSILTVYSDYDSEYEIYTAGNLEGGRGGSYSHIHGSEVAFWKDAEKIVSGLMQGGKPHIHLESTPNGAQGYYYNLVMEALDGNNDWKLHFYPWWFDGQYTEPILPDELDSFKKSLKDDELALVDKEHLTLDQINWRRKKQRELKHLFIQEYPENPKTCFLLSGVGYFGYIDNCFTADMNHEYNPDYKYYAGLDFAQTNDYTVCSIVCKDTKQQVALLRLNKLEWSEMRRQVINLCKKFNVRMLWAEENSMGSTNIEMLRKEMYAVDCKTRIRPFVTTNISKHDIMSELHESLHEDKFKLLPDENQKREFAAFVSKQTLTGLWQLAAAEGEHDDIVIATALSWQASLKSGTGFG